MLSACVTRFAGWRETVCDHQGDTALRRFVRELPSQLTEPGIADGVCQAMILDHPRDVQVLNHHHTGHLLRRRGFRLHQGCRGFVEGITTDVCDAILRSGKLPLRFLSVRTAFVSAGKPALGAAHLGACRSQRLWMCDDAPIADRCQRRDAQVNTDGCALRGGMSRIRFLDLNAHKPATCFFRHGGREDVRVCWQVGVVLPSQPPQMRQLDVRICDLDGAGQPKRPDAAFAACETGGAACPAMLSLFRQRALPKEVGNSVIQVAQGCLGRTCTDLLHPGKRGLLPRIQFLVKCKC